MKEYLFSDKKSFSEFLHNSYIHDAVIIGIEQSIVNNSITLSATNEYFKTSYLFEYNGIESMWMFHGEEVIPNYNIDTVMHVSAENTSAQDIPIALYDKQKYDALIHMGFYMISGIEIHIVCNNVKVSVNDGHVQA